MEKQISPSLRNLFLVHAIVSAFFGIPLFLVPGYTLTLVGWRPEWVNLPPEWGIPPEFGQQIPGTTLVDAPITRILAAALIALAFSSFFGWRASSTDEVKHLIVLEAIFCILSVIAILLTMIRQSFFMPAFGYVVLIIFASFSVAWLRAMRQG